MEIILKNKETFLKKYGFFAPQENGVKFIFKKKFQFNMKFVFYPNKEAGIKDLYEYIKNNDKYKKQ